MECLKKLEWNPMENLPAQLAVGFGFGVISSVFGSYGYIFILYYIIFELIVFIISKNHNLFYRLGIVASAIAGWIIGRVVSSADTIWSDI
jgi:hypothetical protein